VTRYLWVAARRAEGFPTVLCCAAAGVSRQAFYDRRAAQGAAPTARESAEAAPVAEIREIHAASDRAYGSPRVTAELRDRGHRVSPKRVERLMRVHQIAGIRPRRPKRTTTPAPSASKPPDLLGRRFPPGAPDRAWRSDITYIRAGEGWLYLAVVLDVASRRLVGHAMSDRIDTRLVAAALDMAANARGSARPPPAGASPSPPAGPGPPPTTPQPSRSSPAPSENSSTGAATPTAPAPAGRSSNGSPATTPTGATPASDSPHRNNTNSTTVTPRQPTPPNPPDRPTGGNAHSPTPNSPGSTTATPSSPSTSQRP